MHFSDILCHSICESSARQSQVEQGGLECSWGILLRCKLLYVRSKTNGRSCIFSIQAIPISENLVDPNEGIPNTDILVYLTARASASDEIAYASACNFDWDGSSENGIFGRPLAAYINFIPKYFIELANAGENSGSFDFRYLTTVALHEMTHALGFDSYFYPSYLVCYHHSINLSYSLSYLILCIDLELGYEYWTALFPSDSHNQDSIWHESSWPTVCP